MKDKGGWIKVNLSGLKISEFKSLGTFLGRYEDKLSGNIRYYVSHFECKDMKFHIWQYPPTLPCAEVNSNILELTHYMQIEEPSELDDVSNVMEHNFAGSIGSGDYKWKIKK